MKWIFFVPEVSKKARRKIRIRTQSALKIAKKVQFWEVTYCLPQRQKSPFFKNFFECLRKLQQLVHALSGPSSAFLGWAVKKIFFGWGRGHTSYIKFGIFLKITIKVNPKMLEGSGAPLPPTNEGPAYYILHYFSISSLLYIKSCKILDCMELKIYLIK